MNYPVTGLHHITACASGAQEDVDFFTKVVGQRLIKQTILFDGRYAHYHLYYANGRAEPGTVMTTFPYKRVQGRTGSGQIQATVYTVGKGTLPFWVDHLNRHRVVHRGIHERFGQSFVHFEHPCGLAIEVIEDPNETREGWSTEEIRLSESVRGFHGPLLSVREIEEEERFLVDAFGFRKTGVDGAYHRFEIGKGGAGKTLVLLHEPTRPSGSWGFGAGTAHHVALDVTDDEALAEQKGWLEELGYTDCSEIKDRNYFHSIYVRSPGGILMECAATAPGGFARDEAFNQLGTHLLLPPWFEHRRAEILGMLEPIRVPEWHAPVAAPQIAASRRTDATFVPVNQETVGAR
jgi:glyoxalase family protein